MQEGEKVFHENYYQIKPFERDGKLYEVIGI